MTKVKAKKNTSLNDKEILTWIHENPRFLATHATALSALTGAGDSAKNVTNLHTFRADKSEKTSHALVQRQQRMVRTVEANSQIAADIFSAVLNTLKCYTLADLRTFIQTTLQENLALDAARLFLANDKKAPSNMPINDILSYFDDQNKTVLRTLYDASDRVFYGTKGKMIQSDALMKLTNSHGVVIGMLAIASKDIARFHAGQGNELITFFADIISHQLEQCLSV